MLNMPGRPRDWLTDEDIRIWSDVARTTQPLRGKRKPFETPSPPMSNIDINSLPAGGGQSTVRRPVQGAQAPGPAAPPASQPAKLERRFVRRLRQGTMAPGATIDLHGLRQQDAHHRLQTFLRRCQAEGTKAAIIITGKGGGRDDQWGERGVLRRAVPLWLALPDLSSLVLGFQEAGPGLGGAGALIVRIRARKPGQRG